MWFFIHGTHCFLWLRLSYNHAILYLRKLGLMSTARISKRNIVTRTNCRMIINIQIKMAVLFLVPVPNISIPAKTAWKMAFEITAGSIRVNPSMLVIRLKTTIVLPMIEAVCRLLQSLQQAMMINLKKKRTFNPISKKM